MARLFRWYDDLEEPRRFLLFLAMMLVLLLPIAWNVYSMLFGFAVISFLTLRRLWWIQYGR